MSWEGWHFVPPQQQSGGGSNQSPSSSPFDELVSVNQQRKEQQQFQQHTSDMSGHGFGAVHATGNLPTPQSLPRQQKHGYPTGGVEQTSNLIQENSHVGATQRQLLTLQQQFGAIQPPSQSAWSWGEHGGYYHQHLQQHHQEQGPQHPNIYAHMCQVAQMPFYNTSATNNAIVPPHMRQPALVPPGFFTNSNAATNTHMGHLAQMPILHPHYYNVADSSQQMYYANYAMPGFAEQPSMFVYGGEGWPTGNNNTLDFSEYGHGTDGIPAFDIKLCFVCQRPEAIQLKERKTVFEGKLVCVSCFNDAAYRLPPKIMKPATFHNKCGGKCGMERQSPTWMLDMAWLFRRTSDKGQISRCLRWYFYLAKGLDETQLKELNDKWLTVFGFSGENLNQVLKYFREFGEMKQRPNTQAVNCVDICYSFAFQTRSALKSNGRVIAHHKIGVLPCDKFMAGMDAEMEGRDERAEEDFEEDDDYEEEESSEQRQSSSSSTGMGWNRQSSSSTAGMGYNMNKSEADKLGDEELAREIEEVRLLTEKIGIEKAGKADEHSPSKDPLTVLQQQQQQHKLACHICFATVDEVKITYNEAFNREPVCNQCYLFIYRKKDKMEEITKDKCKCPNEDRSEEQLHEICRENPINRAGFKSIAVRCTRCALRLFKWAGFDPSKIGKYVTRRPAAAKRIQDDPGIVKQISAVNQMKLTSEFQADSGADITRLMSTNVSLQYFTEINADKFMQDFNGKGIALEFFVCQAVFKKISNDPSKWDVFACWVEQHGDKCAVAYLQKPLEGLQINRKNEKIRQKMCRNGKELTDHLVQLEDKHAVTYFNGAFHLKDISVDSLLAVLEYLQRVPSVEYDEAYLCHVVDWDADVFVGDQIVTTQGYSTPRATSLVLNHINCRHTYFNDCNELLKELFDGFCCPLVLIEGMDGIETFDFDRLQQCKCFRAASFVAFRKNNRDINAQNAPKISAEAYVAYVNTEWTFTSFVWAPQLSKLWSERSKSKYGRRDLEFSKLLQYVPTLSAEDEVCNLMTNLLFTEPLLEEVFLGPGRVHFIDIELLSGLNLKAMPLTTIFMDLINQLEEAFMKAETAVTYTLFIAGPMVDPRPMSLWKLNKHDELFMVRLFELKTSGRLLGLVQRFMPDPSQPSTSSCSVSVVEESHEPSA